MSDEEKAAQEAKAKAEAEAKAKAERDAADKGDKGHMIPKVRFDQVNEQKKAAEAELKSVADELKADVPEEFASLIPDLPPAALIKWIRAANASGLFDPKGSTDSLDAKRHEKKKETKDFSGMSPQAIMATGYNKK
jgi:hypothetical protein